MDRFCVICGKLLTGRQIKLCSDKECHKKRKYERELIYYQDNLEKIKEYQQEYRQNNRKKISVGKHKYYRDNQESILEIKREYYQNNREEINERNNRSYRRSRGIPEDADLYKESSLERIMREWLQENNIEFIAQYYINLEGANYTKVDFYIPNVNVCLYCDGGYYHLLPRGKKYDEDQNRILPQMGYKVIRMTEAEILEGNRPWGLKN